MVFGDLVTFSCIIDVSPHYFPRSTTVSSLIDEHVAALFLRRPGKAGTEGHQEGKERDLDEHVFGVDSANPLWFAMGNSRLEWTGRTTRGRGSAWRRLFEALVRQTITIEGCGFGALKWVQGAGGWSQKPGRRRSVACVWGAAVGPHAHRKR